MLTNSFGRHSLDSSELRVPHSTSPHMPHLLMVFYDHVPENKRGGEGESEKLQVCVCVRLFRSFRGTLSKPETGSTAVNQTSLVINTAGAAICRLPLRGIRSN